MAVAAAEPADRHHAHRLRCVNPLDGGRVMPTLATWLTFVPASFETENVQSTDGQVMIVSEGGLDAEGGAPSASARRCAGDPELVGWRFRAKTDRSCSRCRIARPRRSWACGGSAALIRKGTANPHGLYRPRLSLVLFRDPLRQVVLDEPGDHRHKGPPFARRQRRHDLLRRHSHNALGLCCDRATRWMGFRREAGTRLIYP